MPADRPTGHQGAAGQSEFVEVLATFNPGETALVKSLLDGEGIAYFTVGEGLTGVYPGVEPVRFMVRRDQAGRARELFER